MRKIQYFREKRDEEMKNDQVKMNEKVKKLEEMLELNLRGTQKIER